MSYCPSEESARGESKIPYKFQVSRCQREGVHRSERKRCSAKKSKKKNKEVQTTKTMKYKRKVLKESPGASVKVLSEPSHEASKRRRVGAF
jgi:hypothetical protein